jgi:hypothetical protein
MPLLLVLLLMLAASLSAQEPVKPRLTIAAGINRPVRHHTFGAPEPGTLGAAYAVSIGIDPRRRLIAPRAEIAYESAPDDRGFAEAAQLGVGATGAFIRRGPVIPYLGGGATGYLSRFDWCEKGAARPAPCAGSHRGIGWEIQAGVSFPASSGPGAALDIRYLSNRKAFDTIVMRLALTF